MYAKEIDLSSRMIYDTQKIHLASLDKPKYSLMSFTQAKRDIYVASNSVIEVNNDNGNLHVALIWKTYLVSVSNLFFFSKVFCYTYLS